MVLSLDAAPSLVPLLQNSDRVLLDALRKAKQQRTAELYPVDPPLPDNLYAEAAGERDAAPIVPRRSLEESHQIMSDLFAWQGCLDDGNGKTNRTPTQVLMHSYMNKTLTRLVFGNEMAELYWKQICARYGFTGDLREEILIAVFRRFGKSRAMIVHAASVLHAVPGGRFCVLSYSQGQAEKLLAEIREFYELMAQARGAVSVIAGPNTRSRITVQFPDGSFTYIEASGAKGGNVRARGRGGAGGQEACALEELWPGAPLPVPNFTEQNPTWSGTCSHCATLNSLCFMPKGIKYPRSPSGVRALFDWNKYDPAPLRAVDWARLDDVEFKDAVVAAVRDLTTYGLLVEGAGNYLYPPAISVLPPWLSLDYSAIRAACRMIDDNFVPGRGLIGSYGSKHYLEKQQACGYMTNGEFILAMTLCGHVPLLDVEHNGVPGINVLYSGRWRKEWVGPQRDPRAHCAPRAEENYPPLLAQWPDFEAAAASLHMRAWTFPVYADHQRALAEQRNRLAARRVYRNV